MSESLDNVRGQQWPRGFDGPKDAAGPSGMRSERGGNARRGPQGPFWDAANISGHVVTRFRSVPLVGVPRFHGDTGANGLGLGQPSRCRSDRQTGFVGGNAKRGGRTERFRRLRGRTKPLEG